MRSTPHFFKGQMPERISDIIISTARELLIVERRYLALDLARDKILAAGGNFEEKKAVCERDLAVVISRCSARIIDNKIKELMPLAEEVFDYMRSGMDLSDQFVDRFLKEVGVYKKISSEN